ncbi:MAG TPA: DUF1622 domain-containing protein [Luteibacter sp.]|jgi:uncharacterized membrane protein|nr:DUF1622 domain-containing protein [Luteibacter sp.]
MSEESIAQAHSLVEWSALGIELLAIVLIVTAILFSTAVYVYGVATRPGYGNRHYELYKRRLGRALLLCLEILVAADIIRTVALDSTWRSVLSLGLLVLVRTFLSWSLILEVEGRWPWSRSPDHATEPEPVTNVAPY